MGETNPAEDRVDKGERRLPAQQIKIAAKITIQGIKLGKTPAEVVSKLRQIGLTRPEAESIEDLARLAYQRSQMRIGTMLMVSGCLWVIALDRGTDPAAGPPRRPVLLGDPGRGGPAVVLRLAAAALCTTVAADGLRCCLHVDRSRPQEASGHSERR